MENNKIHRDNGPAIEKSDGYKAWAINGQYHREDGPAQILSNGAEKYWINDRFFKTKEEWERFLKLSL